jgi:hypothetical protein
MACVSSARACMKLCCSSACLAATISCDGDGGRQWRHASWCWPERAWVARARAGAARHTWCACAFELALLLALLCPAPPAAGIAARGRASGGSQAAVTHWRRAVGGRRSIECAAWWTRACRGALSWRSAQEGARVCGIGGCCLNMGTSLMGC